MNLINNRFAQQPKAKPFAWSYSALKNFETCGHRHNQIDRLKNFAEPEGPALKEGNDAHKILAKAVMGDPLPEGFEKYQGWVDRIRAGTGRIYVENKLALTADKEPVTFFGKGAWFRGVVDVIKIIETTNGDVALLVDWKTGKILEDAVQLALFAAMTFAHYPSVRKVRTEYVWLKDDCTTREDFTPADMSALWQALKPRIDALEHAFNTGEYHKMPSGLCRNYCVVDDCEYYQKGSRG